MTKNFNILILLFLFLTSALNAQINDRINIPSRLYSDRITDDSGNALSGIQVRVKGKGIITYTDVNGEFKIAAKNGDIIVLSKNGKTINSYRLDGRVYYEVQDESDQFENKERKKAIKTSKKLRVDNATLFETFIDSANSYKKNAPTKSIDFIESALKIANQTKNRSQLATSYGVLGDVNMNLKQYDLALSNYTIAVENSQNIIFQLKLARALLLNSDYQKSEDRYNSILKNRGVTTAQKIEVYEGLGDIYAKQNQQTKAFNQYKIAITLAKRLSNTSKIADLNVKISSVLEAQGETSKAESYLLQSNSKVNQSPQKAVEKSKRAADFYSRNNNVDKEVIQREQTLKNLEEANLDEIIIENEEGKLTKPKAKLDLGNAYLKQNKQAEAIQVLEESAAEAESSNDIETQKNAIQKLSEVYVSLGDDDKALSNYKKYVSLVDRLYKEKEEEISSIVNLNRDLSEKQNRISSLEKDRELSESKIQLYQTENRLTIENDRRQMAIIYGLLIGLALLLFSLFWMLRSNRQRKLANNLLALKSLRTQMNPHFIFNALNSVNSFIAQNDERTANRYLTDFSTLMRSVLVNSEEDFISLEKELELLELYLKLEHSRFQDKFDYELAVDKAIDKGQFQIPPMLLQPYIENAVWHGLRYKKEKGFLKVSLSKKNEETILIEISDNGIGRKESAALKTDYQKNQKSKGMQNIKQRIAILNEMYKDKVDVFIEDLYDDETGTKVILTLKKD
jgi:tetratricopeptide (TPR) repeat protein